MTPSAPLKATKKMHLSNIRVLSANDSAARLAHSGIANPLEQS
ncbi:MAG: hypothetical protein OXE83_10190 [Gammaproteobacteria bacterium]|nr:hypothetical protein [Gammaproteobacteria bacterium]